jgi:hypothetical protein
MMATQYPDSLYNILLYSTQDTCPSTGCSSTGYPSAGCPLYLGRYGAIVLWVILVWNT